MSNKSRKNDRTSVVPLIGTYALIVYLANSLGGVDIFWKEFPVFMTGGLLQIANAPAPFIELLPLIFAVLVLDFPVSIGIGCLVSFFLGSDSGGSTKSVLEQVQSEQAPNNKFRNLMLLIIFEELIARWLLISLLPQVLPFLNTPLFLYGLMAVGNVAWALLHIPNYKDGNPLRCLTQLIPNLMYNYVFFKYGLMGSLILHFAYDCVIWSSQKEHDSDGIDFLLTASAFFMAGVSYILIGHPISDIIPWFSETPQYQLENWTIWNYFWLDIFIAASITAVLDFLQYDRSDIGSLLGSGSKGKSSSSSSGDLSAAGILILGILVIVGVLTLLLFASLLQLFVLYATVWFASFFVMEVPFKVALGAIFYTFMQKTNSKSAVARSFFQTVPDFFITYCALAAIGFKAAILYVIASSLVRMPRAFLKGLDS